MKCLRKELTSSSSLDIDDNGRIQELPNELRISIISRLTLKQAASTSLLSKSWRHLHHHIHSLIFDPFRFFPDTVPYYVQKNFSDYLNMINSTLDSYRYNDLLREFSLDMHCLEGADLDRWLEFALARKVETISISMCYLDSYDDGYRYTLHLSKLITEQKPLPGFKSLNKLSLCGVHVDDLQFDLILSNFPNLESLSISDSECLKNISIVGTGGGGLKLKHLDISCGVNPRVVEIRDAVNLVSFESCSEHRDEWALTLSNVPKLTEFHSCIRIFHSIPPCIHGKLRRLKLWVYPSDTTVILESYEELRNLQVLELKVYMGPTYNHHLQKLFPLIEACTSLVTLDAKFLWNHETIKMRYRNNFPFTPFNQLSPHLKILALSGYWGSEEEFLFLMCVMNEVHESLEQLTVEFCDATPEIKQMAIARASFHFEMLTRDSAAKLIII